MVVDFLIILEHLCVNLEALHFNKKQNVKHILT